ncbi:hypothetical protein TVAG_335100 [Trichomonas vaginalis G3]|uniref:Uncharacterized protein n=1 Tax=Trichomonas vaginalis (strain ATCC PRA-98 / G3) TaxID=412133 RepID=A2FK97_TRIV3|nr:hypothetical protein TVAGG3_0715100 [Trichomonas vaginalis G3]EAX94674.1 hypothetical protein TVAG_335100 [Trichomonas vaginalis G3]KAI5510194.1 hypothetical protein TVAGG3_0715100 [Trichomonas vaginalis G3]|eukprot:XP_001307604.1 hypothetical protein [Trichomonas vaginalis G3]
MLGLLFSLSASEFRICIYASSENECKGTGYKEKITLAAFTEDNFDAKTHLQQLGYDISTTPDINIDYQGHDAGTKNHPDQKILNKFSKDDFHPLVIFDSMSNTPTKEITHMPLEDKARCEYHGYILRFTGNFKTNTTKVYNCNGQSDTVSFFQIDNYLGPPSFLKSLFQQDGTYSYVGNAEFQGIEDFPLTNQNKVIDIQGSVSISDVNSYSAVEIKDKYASDAYYLKITISDKFFEFRPFVKQNLFIKFKKPTTSASVLTIDSDPNGINFESGKKLALLYLIGASNEAYMKINIKSSSILALTSKGYTDMEVSQSGAYDLTTIEFVNEQSISAAIQMHEWAKKTNFIINKDINVDLLFIRFATNFTFSLAQGVTSATFGATTMDGNPSHHMKIQKGLSVKIRTFKNYVIYNNILWLRLILFTSGTSTKFETGKLQIDALSPPTSDWKQFPIYIEHKQDVFYTPNNLKTYFDASYDILTTSSSSAITIVLDNEINNPGFYNKQLLMGQAKSEPVEGMSTYSIKFDSSKFQKFNFSLCLSYQESLCQAGDMIYYIQDYVKNDQPTDVNAFTNVINTASKAVNFSAIRITIRTLPNYFTTYRFKIPTLDCSQLDSSMKSKPLEITCKKFYQELNVINADVMDGPIQLNRIKLNTDLESGSIKFKDSTKVTFAHSFIKNAEDYTPKFSANVNFYYTLADIANEFSTDRATDIFAMKYLLLDQAIVYLDEFDPLNFFGLYYGNHTELKVRVKAAENVQPITITLMATKVYFTFDYSQNSEFVDRDQCRFTIQYTGALTPGKIVKFNVTNFKGCAESITVKTDWPDSFRTDEIVTLIPNATNCKVSLANFTGILIKDIPYSVSNKLASRVLNETTVFKLSDGSYLPSVQFPDMSFDTYYNAENKVSSIKGCKAIFKNLEIRFDTISRFDALEVTESLVMYPGSVLEPTPSSNPSTNPENTTNTENPQPNTENPQPNPDETPSKKKIKEGETPTNEPTQNNVDFCNIFGAKVEMKWNAEKHSEIHLADNCPQQPAETIFNFNYDSTILRKVFNVTVFQNNYMTETGQRLIKGFKPSEKTKAYLTADNVFGPPPDTDKDWDKYKPTMEIIASGESEFYLKATQKFIEDNKDKMENSGADPKYTELAQKMYAIKENPKGNGLVLVIFVALVFLIVAIVVWVVMFFLYKDTLVEINDDSSSYNTGMSLTESGSSSTSSKKKKSSGSGSSYSV